MSSNYEEYAWIVVIGVLLAFFMSYGIGANDVANAFATSVGAKTLTLFQACVLAGIFEFLGAVMLGRGVTDTIRKGIVDRDVFHDSPEILMFGMFCALTAAGVWLILATSLEMPVSTTHSIIGGIVGMALVAYGRKAVVWYKYDTDEVFPIQGITAVVLSWLFSPIAAGMVAGFFFWVARSFILRATDSYKRVFYFLPLLVGFATFVNAFYVLDKAVSKQWNWLKDKGGTAASAWIAVIIAVVSTIGGVGFTFWLKKKVDNQIAEGTLSANAPPKNIDQGSPETPSMIPTPMGSQIFGTRKLRADEEQGYFGKMKDAINANDPHAVLETDAEVAEIHARAEVFAAETEEVFRYLQVLTSCCDAFAHGANDVANSIGPFATIWHVYQKQELEKKAEVPIWILFIGGTGIVVGLATYGYQIIRAIGVKLTKITPSRGFSIEMGSALIVVTGSYLGLPLSTTHCQVGATAFVGLLEGTGGISYKVMLKTTFGWVFTLVAVGFMAALLMVLGIRTPNVRNSNSLNAVEQSVVLGGEQAAADLQALCPKSPALEETGRYFRGFEDNFRFQDAVGDAVTFMSAIETKSNGLDCPDPFATPDSDFETAFRTFLPEGIENPDKRYDLARKIIDAETAIEIFKAGPVADDGADAVKDFAEACPDVPQETIDMWASVFAAFKNDHGDGVIVGEPGSPTIFFGEASDLLDELQQAAGDKNCDGITDITTTGVYQHLNPSSKPAVTDTSVDSTTAAAPARRF